MKPQKLGKIALGLIIVMLVSFSCASTQRGSVDSQRKSLMMRSKPDYSAKKPRRRSIKSSRKSLMMPKEQKRSARKMKKRMKGRKR